MVAHQSHDGRYIDGLVRLPHGYTNATSRERDSVIKRYVGPNADNRLQREKFALQRLGSWLPVPPLIGAQADGLVMGFVPGVHGQDIVEVQAKKTLYAVGCVARRLHSISPAALGLSKDLEGSVFVHGDFGAQNMLFDPDSMQASAILDWELSHLGDPIEDLAWAEWSIRFHHPHLTWAIPSLFAGYGSQPSWDLRHAAMLAKCQWAASFVAEWELEPAAGTELWRERIIRTERFTEHD